MKLNMKIFFITILGSLVFVTTACGGKISGTVTAKISPIGTHVVCKSLDIYGNALCQQEGNTFRVVIENNNTKSVMVRDWGTNYMTVCVSPSRWREAKIGHIFIVHRFDDENCDG